MNHVNAQTTGVVNYEHLGIQFTIPEGWVGQEAEGGFIVGHQSKPGFAFLSPMEAKSLEEIRVQGQQGIIEAGGTHLQLQDQMEAISNSSLGGVFKGTLQNTAVTAYLLGILNPHGSGVVIIAASTPEQYSVTHRQLAIDLANSMIFSKPQVPPVAAQWKQKFSNARLTYMESYSSGGGSGGYQIQKEIHLCGQGFFKYSGSSSMSVDTGGAFGSSGGSSAGDGRWEVVGNQQGEAMLRLLFNSGEVYEYTLAYQDNKTLLNGERYFVTYASDGPDYAPNCF
ncbi:hypothetical protein OKW21_000028 [Catalinimonas alkaloidigena]|uniref:hypothetical protein n=1 Tax=Catalinimonas alkaloidigena TaxID=1075417 RepID=UPI002404E451|nr:hypothetical protein [Catalinimonas alkaloidigena]MDF9794765.1 hypothetical protein [Catalinimonas alkaloidigena]